MRHHLEIRRYYVVDLLKIDVLWCHGCTEPIWLQQAKHPDTSPDPHMWPTDGLPRNVLCPHCTHLSAYSVEHVRRLNVPETDPYRIHKDGYDGIGARIEVGCGTAGCATPLRIHTVMVPTPDIKLTAMEVLAQGSVDATVICQNQHQIISLQALGPSIRAVHCAWWKDPAV